MSVEKVKAFFQKQGFAGEIFEFSGSSATVALAAKALGVEEGRIAKSLTFYAPEDGACLMVVCAGDTKIDNVKFKQTFGVKAKMLSPDDVEQMTGYAVGGVCPFAMPPCTTVCLDESLKRFETVYPACGSSNSAVCLTLPQLEELSFFKTWVDVTKLVQENVV